MANIKNIVFDLGGVIMTIDRDRAVKHFEEIGVTDAAKLIDPYEQKGFFLDVESGKVDEAGFCRELSAHVGKEVSPEEAAYGWLGFIVDVPQEKLDYIMDLRKNYKVYLLSNTNPFIQGWARSERFSEAGRPIGDYFDKMYASYEIGLTKPDPAIFEYMMTDASMMADETLFIDDGKANIDVATSLGIHTYQPINGEDWRGELDHII